jgi:hypothetical protein
MSSPLLPPNVTYAGTQPLFIRSIDGVAPDNNGSVAVVGDTTYNQTFAIGNTVAIAFVPDSSPVNGRVGVCGSTQLTPIDSLFDISVPGMTPSGVAMAVYLNSGVPLNPPDNTITSITPGVNKITIFVGIRPINPGDVITWWCPRLSTS